MASRRSPAKRESDPEYGQLVESLRKETPYTQADLAGRLELSLEGYRMYVKGQSRVRADDLPKWSRALDLPAVYIADRLNIELVVTRSPGTLRDQLSALLGPDAGEAIEQTLLEIADLPPEDQRQILQSIRDQVAGRHLHLRRE